MFSEVILRYFFFFINIFYFSLGEYNICYCWDTHTVMLIINPYNDIISVNIPYILLITLTCESIFTIAFRRASICSQTFFACLHDKHLFFLVYTNNELYS